MCYDAYGVTPQRWRELGSDRHGSPLWGAPCLSPSSWAEWCGSSCGVKRRACKRKLQSLHKAITIFFLFSFSVLLWFLFCTIWLP